MRKLIIDTETTGLYPQQGHRIIELAGLEVVNRRATGRTFHFHLDPERDIDFGATEVHGRTWDDLKGKPKFRDIAGEFLDFARGSALECAACLDVLVAKRLTPVEAVISGKAQLFEIVSMLMGLISSVSSRIGEEQAAYSSLADHEQEQE